VLNCFKDRQLLRNTIDEIWRRLKKQVEERIAFYSDGVAPTKNEVAMKSAMDSLLADINIEDPTAGATSDVEMADGITSTATEQVRRKEKKDKKEKGGKKDKKEKKRKPEEDVAVEPEKKKKKKSKHE